MFGNWGLTPTGGDRKQIHASVKRHVGPVPFPPLYSPPAVAATTSTSAVTASVAPFGNGISEDAKSFYSHFQKVRRITDLDATHFSALNISVSQNLPISSLVPSDAIPIDTAEDPANPPEPPRLSRDDPQPSAEEKAQQEWNERVRECLLDNDTAFQVVGRTRRDVKLGNMYRFYQCLELVEPYYDLTPQGEEAGTETNENGKRPASPDVVMTDAPTEKKEAEDVEMKDAALSGTEEKKEEAPKTGPIVRDRSDEKWSMPERFREDLLKSFVEPLSWNSNVRV